MKAFIITFLLFSTVDFLGVWWVKSIDKAKPTSAGLASGLMMLMTVVSMWLAFVSESIGAALGMIMGAGVGSYLGCKYYNRPK